MYSNLQLYNTQQCTSHKLKKIKYATFLQFGNTTQGKKKNKKRNWEISKNIQQAAILQSRVGRSQNFSIQWNLKRNLKKSRFFDKMLGKSHINARKMKIRNILLILRILRMLVKNK